MPAPSARSSRPRAAADDTENVENCVIAPVGTGVWVVATKVVNRWAEKISVKITGSARIGEFDWFLRRNAF